MHHQEKIRNGKLVRVDVVKEEIGYKVSICGDFFLHPEEKIREIELALEQSNHSESDEELEARISGAMVGAQLIGATPKDIARIFHKAVNG